MEKKETSQRVWPQCMSDRPERISSGITSRKSLRKAVFHCFPLVFFVFQCFSILFGLPQEDAQESMQVIREGGVLVARDEQRQGGGHHGRVVREDVVLQHDGQEEDGGDAEEVPHREEEVRPSEQQSWGPSVLKPQNDKGMGGMGSTRPAALANSPAPAVSCCSSASKCKQPHA